MTCFACGRKGHKAKSKECPARVRKCNKCHEKGHYAVMCKRQESSHACVVEVSTVHHVPSQVPRPMMSVGIDGIQVQMLVDTGSGVSLIPSSLYQEQFAHVPLQMSSIRLQGYGGHLLPVRGMMTATVSSDRGCSTEGTLFVVESHSVPLLGRDLQQLLSVTVKDGNVVCAVEGEDAEVLPAIHGFVHRVKVKEGATPVRQKLRPLPLSVRGEVKEHLEKLEKQDVIERVDSSPWVSPVVVTRRRTGGIRLCLDLKEVNKSIISSKHPLPDMQEMLDKLRGARVFSSLDMKSAFNQLMLHQESRDLTAFMTHEGLWRYKRCCFGLSSIPAAFQKVMEAVLTGLPGVMVYMDDIIVFGRDAPEHDVRLQQVLARLNAHRITLNEKKCLFGVPTLDFLGLTVSAAGISVSVERTRGMTELTSPRTKADLQSALGLFGFYARFVQGYSSLVEPLRAELRSSASHEFEWSEELELVFRRVIALITSSSALAMFDPTLPTVVTTDASDVGLGGVLSQIHPEGERVVAFASATLSSAQRKYCATEKEALAALWAIEHWHRYLFGIHFTLRTDHQALLRLLTSRGVGRAGMRISRWASRLLVYDFEIRHVPGKCNVADGLSRLPAVGAEAAPDDEEQLVAEIAERVERLSAVSRGELRESVQTDPVLRKLKSQLDEGWPARIASCPDDLRPFFRCRLELSAADGLIFKGDRIVVPEELRRRLLDLAHEGHQGTVRTKQRLRELFWWPGMDANVECLVRQCAACATADKTVKVNVPPLNPVPLPQTPWSKVGIDFIGPMEGGGVQRRFAIVMVDYYSKWPEVAFCAHPNSESVIEFMEAVASREGYPEELVCDNGTAFTSAVFTGYLKEVGVRQIRVTPYHPRGAGAVERFNKNVKNVLQTATADGMDWKRAIREFLLSYRSTPHSTTGRSPAELLRGRQLRTKLHAAAERRPVDDSTTRARVATQQEKQKKYFDLRYCARPRDYEVGEWVRFRLVPRPRKGRQAFSSPRMVMERRGRVSYKLSCGTLVHAERLTRSTDPSSGSPPARRSEVGGCPSPAGGGGGPPSPARGDGGPPPSPARGGGGGRPSPKSAGEGEPPTSDDGGPLSRGRASSPARGDGGPPPSPAGPPSPARGEGSSSPIRGDSARGEGSSSPIRGDSVRGEGSSSPIRGNGARGEGSSSPIRGNGGGPLSLARDGGERRTRCGRRIKTPARFR
ncbi:uncharacterized protein K02A2.6-like isoform X1 [Amphibalanus amphitrite]|uniref:uncharacterized protein K02A2.6-like isoform X1 n=1 Tax=Amphibalanus amphitrite TaxID=1232801 RepID=UPI001C905598|nr:uncharacterized protein K02A2.6-like isoform X1 [Amphibalanus amphitrite]